MTREQFWDKHYRSGRGSGKGSIGAERRWKWGIIKQYVNIERKSLLDVGCGDLSFMSGKKPLCYTGLDISSFIIESHKKNRAPNWVFIVGDVTTRNWGIVSPVDVVLCMDVLFHIMDDERFGNLLKNLNDWTVEWLFISTWARNPLPHLHDSYQYFRDLNAWLDHLPDLELIAEHQNQGVPLNTLYIFKKEQKQ